MPCSVRSRRAARWQQESTFRTLDVSSTAGRGYDTIINHLIEGSELVDHHTISVKESHYKSECSLKSLDIFTNPMYWPRNNVNQFPK